MKPATYINAFIMFAAFLLSTSALAEKSIKPVAITSSNATVQSTSNSVFIKNIALDVIDTAKEADAFSKALKAANYK